MKQLYMLWLNGKPYGKGGWDYMVELMKDYARACDMYGESEVEFKIEKLNYKEGQYGVTGNEVAGDGVRRQGTYCN